MKHSRLEMFEDSVNRLGSVFDRALDNPVVIAGLVLVSYAVIVVVLGMMFRIYDELNKVGVQP